MYLPIDPKNKINFATHSSYNLVLRYTVPTAVRNTGLFKNFQQILSGEYCTTGVFFYLVPVFPIKNCRPAFYSVRMYYSTYKRNMYCAAAVSGLNFEF